MLGIKSLIKNSESESLEDFVNKFKVDEKYIESFISYATNDSQLDTMVNGEIYSTLLSLRLLDEKLKQEDPTVIADIKSILGGRDIIEFLGDLGKDLPK